MVPWKTIGVGVCAGFCVVWLIAMFVAFGVISKCNDGLDKKSGGDAPPPEATT